MPLINNLISQKLSGRCSRLRTKIFVINYTLPSPLCCTINPQNIVTYINLKVVPNNIYFYVKVVPNKINIKAFNNPTTLNLFDTTFSVDVT